MLPAYRIYFEAFVFFLKQFRDEHKFHAAWVPAWSWVKIRASLRGFICMRTSVSCRRMVLPLACAVPRCARAM